MTDGALVLRILDDVERRINERISALTTVDYGEVRAIVASEIGAIRPVVAPVAEVIPAVAEVIEPEPTAEAVEENTEALEEIAETLAEIREELAAPETVSEDVIPTPAPAPVSPQESKPSRDSWWHRPMFGIKGGGDV